MSCTKVSLFLRVSEFSWQHCPLRPSHVFGTCIESLRGGNHIRAWQQMGSGAWFLAASKEEDVLEQHTIVPNGYNLGRQYLVDKIEKSATNQT